MRVALGVCCVCVLAAGCASADSVCRSLYQAFQVREDLVNPSAASRPADRRPGYDDYQAERQRRVLRSE